MTINKEPAVNRNSTREIRLRNHLPVILLTIIGLVKLGTSLRRIANSTVKDKTGDCQATATADKSVGNDALLKG
jgi:hypothetical protein